MTIEEEIFKKSVIVFEKLIKYGFKKEKDGYYYKKNIMNNTFEVIVKIDFDGIVSGKIIDKEFDEEYKNFRIEEVNGDFVGKVRDEYKRILKDIKAKCSEDKLFIYPQSNRIAKLINEKYNVLPEFLWKKFPNYGVFRNEKSNKWFGIIMNIKRNKIVGDDDIEIETLNIKLDNFISEYENEEGIYKSFHLNKKNWVSIILDDTLEDKKIMELIDISYKLSDIKGKWIIPANTKYYDMENAFKDVDTIIWKQSTNINCGDIVYMYVSEPISAILYKCEVVENNIPYDYKDSNLIIQKVMKIKLLKEYKKDKFTFKKLNKYGIKAIRGPRSVPDDLAKDLK